MTVWQIAAGTAGRDYSSVFIDHDLMFLGPGDPGEYTPRAYEPLIESGRLSPMKANSIGHFRSTVAPEDLVLLRMGHRVLALGVVPEEDLLVWRPPGCRR